MVHARGRQRRGWDPTILVLVASMIAGGYRQDEDDGRILSTRPVCKRARGRARRNPNCQLTLLFASLPALAVASIRVRFRVPVVWRGHGRGRGGVVCRLGPLRLVAYG